MFSKLAELTGIALITVAISSWARWEAGLLFAGVAIVLIGSVTDDRAVGMALKRGTGWMRYAWWSQLAKENGLPIPDLSVTGWVACACGGDEDCPVCGGTGVVPDPTLQVNGSSPHPKIRVDPEAQARSERLARAREERAKGHDLTPALSRHDYDLERLG